MLTRQIKLFLMQMFVLGLCAPAYALGIWAEPYAGYEISDREQNNTSYDATGLNLGFRLGATNNSVFFGVEYALANLDVDHPTNDDEIKTKDIGLFFGTEFSTLRLWFTYWLDSEGDSDNSNSTYSGDGGYKLGLGFKVFNQASLNVEKTLRTWKEDDGTKMQHKMEIDGIMVSLSLPLSF